MWPQFVKSLKALAAFRRARGGFAPAARATPTVKRLWSGLGVKASDVALLQELVSSGHRLQTLLDSPGWADVLEAKAFYQSRADWQAKALTGTDQQRFQAAVEWSALEGFFKELYRRVRSGEEAARKLSRVLTKTF